MSDGSPIKAARIRELNDQLRCKGIGLTRQQIVAALRRARRSRYPRRDRVMILLSVRAGLRAGEIAKLTWPTMLDADGRIGNRIELHAIPGANTTVLSSTWRAAA
jgi:integrase